MAGANKYAHINPLSSHKSPESNAALRDDLSVARRFFALAHRMDKRYLPLQIAAAVVGALAPFPSVIFPKFIIDELTGAQRPVMFIVYVGVYLLLGGLIDQIAQFLNMRVTVANMRMIHFFEARLGERNLTMKFEAMEDPAILDMKQKALVPIEENNAIEQMMRSSLGLLRNLITLCGLLGILFTLDWVLIIALLVLVALNLLLYHKQQQKEVAFEQEMAVYNRQWSYYRSLATDFSMGKDIRLYHMCPFLMEKICSYHRRITGAIKKVSGRYMVYEIPSGMITALQTGLIYAYMVYKVVAAGLSIGSFSMYVSAATQFTAAINDFSMSIVRFRSCCRYLSGYMEYEALSLSQDEGGNAQVGEDMTIEFRHVWFKYPRREEYVLKDVSITIRPGEKLSVVGRNGAGKTTFIKLLCRLYAPDKGEILLGGVNIREISHDEYMKLLAVVFQDYMLFAFTVKENIAFDETDNTPDEEVRRVLRQAGLLDSVDKLAKGADTPIYKTFDPDGVEMSGGQSQKLAIARAIFKHAPIVVLDEPTAALDPFAEAEIYTRFHELVESNTAIYISHRLSSCRFCDHIAVFDQGELVQYGTHDELVGQDGPYAAMFHAQAQYYQR